jgi:uncharacterized membrane protein YGL010W
VRSLAQHLSNYGDYHRDRRNLATHFVGIPLIVLGIAGLLSRPSVVVAGVPLAPVVLVVVASVLFYLSLDVRLGLVMAVLFGGAAVFGTYLAAQSTAVWLGVSIALFVIGWAFQLVGHVMEGRKPAFVDDLLGLLVGPLYLVVEVALALGLRLELRHTVKHGPSETSPSR